MWHTLRVEFKFDIGVKCVRIYESNLSSISVLNVSEYTSRIKVQYRCYTCQSVRVEFKFGEPSAVPSASHQNSPCIASIPSNFTHRS